jgi:hypothetical protein
VRAETDYLRLFFARLAMPLIPLRRMSGSNELVRHISEKQNKKKIMPRRPDLEYLKAVNQAAPPVDPQVLFLLMGQYGNANLQAEGIAKLGFSFDPSSRTRPPPRAWIL